MLVKKYGSEKYQEVRELDGVVFSGFFHLANSQFLVLDCVSDEQEWIGCFTEQICDKPLRKLDLPMIFHFVILIQYVEELQVIVQFSQDVSTR